MRALRRKPTPWFGRRRRNEMDLSVLSTAKSSVAIRSTKRRSSFGCRAVTAYGGFDAHNRDAHAFSKTRVQHENLPVRDGTTSASVLETLQRSASEMVRSH